MKIGFCYPKVSFFDLESKKTIKKINGKPIDNAFTQFLNYQTSNNTLNDCQMAFKRRFENSKLLVGGLKPKTVTFKDGTTKIISYDLATQNKSMMEEITEGIKVDEKYMNWKKIRQGYKVVVLQKDNVALVKVKDFVYLKGRGGEINCQEQAKDSTHCGDVQVIRTALNEISKNVEYLIIDLQGNYGGQENTRFIAELCPNEFFDLRVQYKKTPLLVNEELRAYLFYNSYRAENWYQNLISTKLYSQTELGDFLPVRGDFCRGDSLCRLKPIPSNNSLQKKFDKIIVLVNEGTASSGDDFAYRMKEYGNALIAGQPQSADLTYSLVSVLFYLDSEGQIKKIYLGNRQRKYEVNGTELFKFSIPYSRTIDKNGNLLQGSPLELDLEVELTKDNFLFREEFVLESVIENLTNKD